MSLSPAGISTLRSEVRRTTWSNWPHAPGPEGLTPMSLVFHRSLRAQSEELYGMGGRRDEIGRLFDPDLGSNGPGSSVPLASASAWALRLPPWTAGRGGRRCK